MTEQPKKLEEFFALVKQDFGIEFVVYKDKAGYTMVWEKNDTNDYFGRRAHSVYGPDCGHSHSNASWVFTFNGWAYELQPDGAWQIQNDGRYAWRDKDSEPLADPAQRKH